MCEGMRESINTLLLCALLFFSEWCHVTKYLVANWCHGYNAAINKALNGTVLDYVIAPKLSLSSLFIRKAHLWKFVGFRGHLGVMTRFYYWLYYWLLTNNLRSSVSCIGLSWLRGKLWVSSCLLWHKCPWRSSTSANVEQPAAEDCSYTSGRNQEVDLTHITACLPKLPRQQYRDRHWGYSMCHSCSSHRSATDRGREGKKTDIITKIRNMNI